MRRIRFLLFTYLVAAAATPSLVQAQQIRSPFRFVDERQSAGIFGGYVVTEQGELDLGPQSGPIAGGRYAIRIGGPLELEGTLAYLPTTRTVFDTIPQAPFRRAIGEADIELALAMAGLRFNVTGPRTYYGLMPYLVAGGGVAFDLSGDAPAERSLPQNVRFDFGTRFAGQVGAGVEWFATRHVTLRADARNLLWKLRTPPAFQRPAQDIVSSEWASNFQFALGLGYRF